MAPQVWKNDQNVVEEEEDDISDRENNNSTKMCKVKHKSDENIGQCVLGD